jgi:hypothetical protein
MSYKKISPSVSKSSLIPRFGSCKPAFGLVLFSLAINAGAQSAQQSASTPSDPGVDLDGFGCQVVVSSDCPARIRCVGEGEILFKDNRGVSEAVKVANSRARNELARFFSEKRKAEEALTTAQRTYQKQGAGGDRSEREFGRLTEEVSTSQVEAVLRGVVLIGRQIDMDSGLAKVWIGQSCQSRAAADGASSTSSTNSNAPGVSSQSPPSTSAPASGGPPIFGGNPQTTRRPNLDRF